MKIRVEEFGRTRVLTVEGSPVTVGRDSRNSVVLTSETVSAFHLELRAGTEGLEVRDLGSRNGTFLDAAGERIPLPMAPQEMHPLGPGDSLVLGTDGEPIRIGADLEEGDTPKDEARNTIRVSRPVAEVRLDHIERGSWPRLLELNRGLMDADDLDGVLEAGLNGLLELVPSADHATVFLAGAGEDDLTESFDRVVRIERGVDDVVDLPVESFEHTLTGDALVRRAIDRREGLLWDERGGERAVGTVACAPLWAGTRVLGALQVEVQAGRDRSLTEADLDKALVLSAPFALALNNARRLVDARADRSRLVAENSRLRTDVARRGGGPQLLGDTGPIRGLRETLSKVARTSLPVLITGETGTGKELVANVLHRESPRGDRPFVACNVAAIAPSLMEAELFGVTRGAYTGAAADRPGLFEAAGGGTLFLDEVGELTPSAQATLLRVLEEGEVRRLGETGTRTVDVRIVSATNRDLEKAVSRGTFRQDLLFRINAVVLEVPPLRERREDIPLLSDHLLGMACTQQGRPVPEMHPGVLEAFIAFHWPGNVRQLGNELSRAVAITPPGDPLTVGSLSPDLSGQGAGNGVAGGAQSTGDLRDVLAAREREHVVAVLRAHQGNRTHAARALGITRAGLQKIIKRHEIVD